MLRLFLALSLPPSHCQALAALCAGVPGLQWVPPENLHLTLRFIGPVANDVAEDIHNAMTDLRAEPFPVTLKGFGTFGRKRPDHVWVGVETNPALHQLAAKIEQCLQNLGLPAESRRFVPHVTLGRGRSVHPDHLHHFMLRHEPFALSTITVADFHLFQSHLTQNGPQYQTLARYSLG